MPRYVRLLAAVMLMLSASHAASQAADTPLQGAGVAPYAFSDELGGFAIAAVSGIGTRDDPIRISQDFFTASPVTLVIRATRPINPFGLPALYATGTLHIVLDIRNETGIPWIGFELELQEEYEEPSIYGDGLSFDQRRQEADGAYSTAFLQARTDYEPYDRLLFEEGALDPRARGEFRFLVTDLTPLPTFYIKLDPRIPAS